MSPEPAVLEWVAAIEELSAGWPDLTAADWPRRRAAATGLADALATRFTLPGPAGCEVTEHRVPTRGGEIAVRRYHSPGAGRAAYLWLHGGGFVLGGIHEVVEDRLLRRRAADSGVDVFAAGYRLAPEHPFPAALDDCLDALAWLRASAADFGVDRVGAGGSSAGGNLAALVAVHCGPALDHLVLEVPAVTLDVERDASNLGYGELTGTAELPLLRAAYLGDEPAGWTEPAGVPDLTGLPATLVITAECDALRDSGQRFAARLAEAGVAVESWCAPGQAHGSGALTRTSATAREWQDRVSAFLRTRIP
ncbi:alpha/beta hydrolase [Amycolatopsis sp. OK19-0408]|uniref:Alpha/beta hydrolase n=1 Tax=Amycolatopsis iheyensis TaxID=2945988 RepID=A0A9X2NFA4_9PSEU|nr:alpha/beta hydrolase [Amycolatopsis iheyensis]MCR6487741.1 alpha/beta hydrolase [Amycolatopsis iheyensis]